MKKTFRETKMIPVYTGAYAVPYYNTSYSFKRVFGSIALSLLIGAAGAIPGFIIAMIFQFPPNGGTTGIIITTQLGCFLAALLYNAGKGNLRPTSKKIVVWSLEDREGEEIQ